MIHDHGVIRTAELFPYTAKVMFVGVRNDKINKSDVESYIEYVLSVAVYQKYLNEIGRDDNFLAKTRKLSILPTSLDIFDIRQHYVRILYTCI